MRLEVCGSVVDLSLRRPHSHTGAGRSCRNESQVGLQTTDLGDAEIEQHGQFVVALPFARTPESIASRGP